MDLPEFQLKATFACLPRTTRGMPLVLGGDPSGKNLLYCCGNSVIIRDVKNPALCDVYTEHSQSTTVAKYAPSGFYIASGDTTGKLRIWDTTQKTHPLKKEYQFLAGAVRDVGWAADGQRLAVVGDGRDRFGHVFLLDTGTSNGALTGQAKALNSVDFRPARPLRIVTASDDYSLALFDGPPFKFKNQFQRHARFALCVRYSPDGALFASGGADGKVCLFEGLEGEPAGELVDPACKNTAHNGSVYSLSWCSDNDRLLTCSGDKTSKVWSVASKQLICCFSFGQDIEDQQLGCIWLCDQLLSVSLAGFIAYLDPDQPAGPRRLVQGHNKPITSLAVADDKTIFSADMDGNVVRWDAASGEAVRLAPRFHKAQVQKVACDGQLLVSVSIDDTLAATPVASLGTGSDAAPAVMKLEAQPRGVDVRAGLVAVACQQQLLVLDAVRLEQRGAARVPAVCACAALHPDGSVVAAGDEDGLLRVWALSGAGAETELRPLAELRHGGAVTDVAFSPDGRFLAACDAARRVVPYSVPSYQVATPKEWTFHTARVNCVAWSPDSQRLATGSLDTSIVVWSVRQPGEYPVIIKCAHQMSQITGIGWLDAQTVVSAGQDGNIKQWTLPPPASA